MIYLLRHGQTISDAERRMQGRSLYWGLSREKAMGQAVPQDAIDPLA